MEKSVVAEPLKQEGQHSIKYNDNLLARSTKYNPCVIKESLEIMKNSHN